MQKDRFAVLEAKPIKVRPQDRGVVTHYESSQRYGYLQGPYGSAIFHANSVHRKDLLTVGSVVRYSHVDTQIGARAIAISVLESNFPSATPADLL